MNNPLLQYPLHGVRVLELATLIAAPSAAELLCAYGADVTKVENLGGDDLRYVGRFNNAPYGDYHNPTFTVQNGNKKLIAINLKSETGKQVFLQLLEKADVFITNLREDALARLGLNYQALKDSYPRLIYAHLLSFGPKGPSAKEPGYDATAFWSRTGCLADWPEEGAVPFRPSYGFGDNATGMSLFSGILMSLYGREQTGQGTYVTTSLFASGIWYNCSEIILSQFRETPPNRDLKRPNSMFSNIYQCKDGRWIGVYAADYERTFPKFAKAMGMEDLLEDPRYGTYDEMHRSGAVTEGVERCQALFRQKTAEEWKAYLAANDFACEIAVHIKDLYHDEQALANDYIKTVAYADDLNVIMASPPICFDKYEHRDYRPCGGIGEDTNSLLLELGYSEKDIQRLKEQKSIR